MAKQNKTPEQDGEVTFQFFKISIKGSDMSVQKGLDTIAATLAQAGMVQLPPTRQLRNAPAKHIALDNDGAPDETEDAAYVDADEEAEAPVAVPTQKKTPAKKSQPNYKVINEISADDVSPTLSEFMTKYPGESTLDKYLAIAYWYKHHRGIEDITVAHFFTAYKLLEWVPPVDPGQPVRDLRHLKRQWLVAGAKQGTSTIKNLGESMVLKFGKTAA